MNKNSRENINDIARLELEKTLLELHQSPFNHRMPIPTFHSTNYREQEWKINKNKEKRSLVRRCQLEAFIYSNLLAPLI